MRTHNNAENINSPYFTKAEAARYLKISIPTLDRWEAEGRFKVIRDGRFVRYRKEDLDVYMRRRDVPSIDDLIDGGEWQDEAA